MREEFLPFAAAAQELIGSFVAPLEAMGPPNLIYHYTNAAGLRGILESGHIWLTNVTALNDPSEINHGLVHIVNALKMRADSLGVFGRIFVEGFEKFFGTGGALAANVHVCSFSSEPDDLGQWRAYADDGHGFAIGFDARSFESAFSASMPKGSGFSFPISYDEAKLIELQTALVSHIYHLIEVPQTKEHSDERSSYLLSLITALLLYAVFVSSLFKHKAYVNEKEYRFIAWLMGEQKKAIKHRVRGRELVPYVDFDWRSHAPSAIRRIIVGPSGDRSSSRSFVQRCLDDFDSQPRPEVSDSAIPYRGA